MVPALLATGSTVQGSSGGSVATGADTNEHVLSWDGSGRSAPIDIDGTAGSEAVSCALTSLCMERDSVGNAISLTRGLWSAAGQVDLNGIESIWWPSCAVRVAVELAGGAVSRHTGPPAPP